MTMFTNLTNGNILPQINIDSLPEVKISNDMKSRLKQMFEDSGDVNNVKIMDYTSSFHVKKSGNTVIFPNQYYLIAAHYFDYATALVKYFSFFDDKIRDNKNLEQIIYDKKFDQIPLSLFDNDVDRRLFIFFLQNLGKDFVNKDKDSVKSRPTMDVFGSCVLSKISVPNASSSTLGDIIYFLSKDVIVYEKLKKEVTTKEEHLLFSSESAAGFLMKVLKKTLETDSNFSLMNKKFNETQVSLSVNGFVFGRNVKQLPTRESDYDSSVLWRYNENEYCGYKEFYPVNLVQYFFPEYNDSYKGRFRLEEKDGKYVMFELNGNQFKHNVSQRDEAFPIFSQIIYYGVPGCGKSYEINKKIKNLPDYNRIRTVFHPEYCNADFVGQILPEIGVNSAGHSIVEYKFKPGPFTEIVRRAYLNPDEEFCLVIEEINRGNAAAIFGDMFQLLDRLESDENSLETISEHVYGKGWSAYGVDNQDINAYIRNQTAIFQDKPEHCSKVNRTDADANLRLYKSLDIESDNLNVTWREKNGNVFTPKSKHLHFSANTAIRLPPNLSIYATMNTSDQNVFTLDNAFQRRWEMKQVPNELKKTGDDAEVAQYNQIIKNNVSWGDFRKAINEVILDSAQANGLSSMEDKRLGGWFFTPSDNFAEKVLKYLWDDAFKFDRKTQFGEIKTLEKLVEDFNNDGFKVFKDERISKLQKDSSTTPNGSTQNDSPEVNG